MRVLALSVLLLLGLVFSQPTLGQTAQLEDKQKSVMLYDLRMDLVTGSELGKSLGLAEKMAGLQGGGDGPDPSKMSRIFGGMSAPANMQEAMSMQMGEMPVEFFVRMQFNNPNDLKEFMDLAVEDNGGTVEKNGKTYYKPPADEGAPEGLLMHQFDDKTIEMGTEAYVFRDKSAGPPFSDGLRAAWANVPKNQALRIAIDLEGAKDFVAEAVAMGKQQIQEPTAGEFLNLVNNIKNLRLSVDIQGGNLVTLQATGKGGTQTEDFKGGMDALLFMAKTAGGQGVKQLEQMDPKGAGVLKEILGALKAEQDGDEISVVIPTPGGFNEAVQGAVQMMGPMMGGGGLGGLPPSGGRPGFGGDDF